MCNRFATPSAELQDHTVPHPAPAQIRRTSVLLSKLCIEVLGALSQQLLKPPDCPRSRRNESRFSVQNEMPTGVLLQVSAMDGLGGSASPTLLTAGSYAKPGGRVRLLFPEVKRLALVSGSELECQPRPSPTVSRIRFP
jgi:hypothetical protein